MSVLKDHVLWCPKCEVWPEDTFIIQGGDRWFHQKCGQWLEEPLLEIEGVVSEQPACSKELWDYMKAGPGAKTIIDPTTQEPIEVASIASTVLFGYDIQEDILRERVRQDKKWGVQNHAPGDWFPILMEEVGEAARAHLDGNYDNYLEELVQVAAVAVAMIECYNRNKNG